MEEQKVDYVEMSKNFVRMILNTTLTIDSINDLYEIQVGNKDVLLGHLKAIVNIMNKAIEELERSDD